MLLQQNFLNVVAHLGQRHCVRGLHVVNLQNVVALRGLDEAAVLAGLQRERGFVEFLAQNVLANPTPVAAFLRLLALGVHAGHALETLAGIELCENLLGEFALEINRRPRGFTGGRCIRLRRRRNIRHRNVCFCDRCGGSNGWHVVRPECLAIGSDIGPVRDQRLRALHGRGRRVRAGFWILAPDCFRSPPLDKNHPQFDLVTHLVLVEVVLVIRLDLVGRDDDGLLGLVAPHRLNDHAIADLLAILRQREVFGLECLDECGAVAAVIVGNDVVDLLVDDRLRDFVTFGVEFLDNERALDEAVERVHLRLAHLLDQLLARKIAPQLLDNGLDELTNLAVGDDVGVDDGRHAVDDFRAQSRTGQRQRRYDHGHHLSFHDSLSR